MKHLACNLDSQFSYSQLFGQTAETHMTCKPFQVLVCSCALTLAACEHPQETAQVSDIVHARPKNTADITQYISEAPDQDDKQSRAKTPYEIAAMKAETELLLAKRHCLTLPAEQQPNCNITADAEYEVTKAGVESLYSSNARR